jgi:hypothetical protein
MASSPWRGISRLAATLSTRFLQPEIFLPFGRGYFSRAGAECFLVEPGMPLNLFSRI